MRDLSTRRTSIPWASSRPATSAPRYAAIGLAALRRDKVWIKLPEEVREALEVLDTIVPFRTNRYVIDELIDWTNVADDPIFRLNFPHPDMVSAVRFSQLRSARLAGDMAAIARIRAEIHCDFNPHPSAQRNNIPYVDGTALSGIQHKYRNTVLYFPSAGQTCHAYCEFCFRWAQFVGERSERFSANSPSQLLAYLESDPQISDVLITGGDPLIMATRALRRVIEPLLRPGSQAVQTIRIATKSLAFWPYRFTSDPDADDLLRLFEEVVRAGKHFSLMIHCTHPVELEGPVVDHALRRIRETGAVVRLQSPLVRHVNDDPRHWARLWTAAVQRGVVPYYMFVERNTGPHDYFAVPLVRAWRIFSQAYAQVSGLARTVRGPVMSTDAGKLLIDGVIGRNADAHFVLQFLQARDQNLVRRPFLAQFDPQALWVSDLEAADGTPLEKALQSASFMPTCEGWNPSFK